MKRLKLLTLAFLTISNSYAQFGIALSEGSSQEISKISPSKTIPVKDIIPDLSSEITAAPKMKGMTSCIIEFYDKDGKKISECPDKINGMPSNGSFIEGNTKYLFVTFDKDLASWVFQQIEVSTGKTLSKVKIQSPSPMSMINVGGFNESKTEYIYVGDPKTKTSDTSIAVISVSSGEIVRKFGLSKTRVNKILTKVLNDKALICALNPDKKSKVVNAESASNLAAFDIITGEYHPILNNSFKDNKNTPTNIYSDGNGNIYVTYNVGKPIAVAYEVGSGSSFLEIKDLGIPQCNTKDGKYLFCASGNTIKVLNVNEKKVVNHFSEDDQIPVPYTNIKISNDGQYLYANRVGYYAYGLEAKDHISVWEISRLVK